MGRQRILIVDDDEGVCYSLKRHLEADGREVEAVMDPLAGFDRIDEWNPDLVLLDIKMPGLDGLTALKRIKESRPRQLVVVITAHGTTETAIEAMKRGAFDYLMKPFDDVGAFEAVVARALDTARLVRTVRTPGHSARTDRERTIPDQADAPADRIVGVSPRMQEVYKQIGQVAERDVPVLIRGESGTGKELVARAIYQHSRRADGPFLAVNCAAIPESLLESELFGHERGSFTGAEMRRIGRFEAAAGGTIFLDEVGDLSLATQAKILRVLQDGTFQRVGGSETLHADTRVIAATHRNLEQAVADGGFREDLYYRLKVMQIRLPPLRDRLSDMAALVEYFIARYRGELRATAEGLSDRAHDLLLTYAWPGNVRQLENVIRRALVVERGLKLTAESLALDTEPDLAARPAGAVPASAGPDSVERSLEHLVDRLLASHHENLLDELQRVLIARALEKMGGNQLRTAKLLGISRNTLHGRIEEYGLVKQVHVLRGKKRPRGR